IQGKVNHSVLFQGVSIGKNSIIKDSVIMPDAKIEEDVIINKAIVGSNAIIRRGCKIGDGNKIAVIASREELKSGTTLEPAEVL
ncbi:glucose-1-phosphate adenylyltransferase, partial [Clostridium perfringens]